MIIKITIIFVIINDPITPSLFFQDLLYSPHFSRFQPYFDAVGVAGGFGEYPIDITLGEGAGALVFFHNDADQHSGFDIRAFGSFHFLNLSEYFIHQFLGFSLQKKGVEK